MLTLARACWARLMPILDTTAKNKPLGQLIQFVPSSAQIMSLRSSVTRYYHEKKSGGQLSFVSCSAQIMSYNIYTNHEPKLKDKRGSVAIGTTAKTGLEVS